MSFDDDRDPVMELLEAMASERGYRLVPLNATMGIRSPFDVKLASLAAELAHLSTDALADRTKSLQAELGVAESKMTALRKRYSQLSYNYNGLALPGAVVGNTPIPERLRAEHKWAHAASQLALRILGDQVARQALNYIEARPAEPEAPLKATIDPDAA